MKILITFCISFVFIVDVTTSARIHKEIFKKSSKGFDDDGPGDPLYLTPLIKEGRFEQAQEAALAEGFYPTISYSGFITVNEEYGSNIYFWFFPAESTYVNGTDDYWDNDVPIILWSDGGPGGSCMMSVFNGNGPYNGGIDGLNYTENPLSWHKNYHTIFVDNPVTVGFSHTNSEDGYMHSAEEAGKDIYEFLTQFFQMFPHLQKNPFYNAGVSYGGKYSTEFAHRIHQQNLNNPSIHINLTGLIHDSPWVDAYTQTLYGEVLFGAGLISENTRNDFLKKEAQIKKHIEDKDFKAAFPIWWNIVLEKAPERTGYSAMYNMRDDDPIRSPVSDMTNYLTLNSTRRALHVGNIPFVMANEGIFEYFQEDMMQSSAPKLDEILKNGYKYLVYAGNMDVITGHLGVRNLIDSLTWEGKDELLRGESSIWKVDDRVAGYITNSQNASLLIVRNAGHACGLDEPKWVQEAFLNFIG